MSFIAHATPPHSDLSIYHPEYIALYLSPALQHAVGKRAYLSRARVSDCTDAN
jgi:hypothetical protein